MLTAIAMAINGDRTLSRTRGNPCLQRRHEHADRPVALYISNRDDVESAHHCRQEGASYLAVWYKIDVKPQAETFAARY